MASSLLEALLGTLPKRRVYFAFHYVDVASFRANVVRNHNALKNRDDVGFFDASLWEKARKSGQSAIRRLIDGGINNTSVTCVLIGSQTYSRRWVKYEIFKSVERGNGLLGVHVNGVADKHGLTYRPGLNPFSYTGFYRAPDGIVRFAERRLLGDWYDSPDLPLPGAVHPAISSWPSAGVGFDSLFPVYDWIGGNGYSNFDSWVQAAAVAAGR